MRIDIENGWYHVSARDTECRSLFADDLYGVDFLELLEEMSLRIVKMRVILGRSRGRADMLKSFVARE